MAWSALLGAIAAGVLAAPVYAEPTPNTIPNAGSRPVPSGALLLPGAVPPLTGGGPVAPPSTSGPLAAQIFNAETEVLTLAENLRQKDSERSTARADVAIAHRQLEEARAAVTVAESSAENAAAHALKEAAELPPGAFGSDLHGLSELSRIQRGERSTAESDAAQREVARAKDAERVAQEAYDAAVGKEQGLIGQFNTLQATFKSKEAALVSLKTRNADQLAVIEREREAQEQQLGAGYLNDEIIAGKAAHPNALKAVAFALGELGKPYLWGAEGPSRYDCSGLMWAAYRHAGYFQLPRVSRDQFTHTRANLQSQYALLPGDLVFFSSNGTASGIHHVGMYIGDGKMVHSPTTGDVVKVSTVWWSRFFAATRIYGSVTAPSTPPTTSPTTPPPSSPKPTTPAPTKTTKPPATTKPPTTPPSKPPTTPPSTPPTTPPASPTPDPTPSPTPAPGEPTRTTPPATNSVSPDASSAKPDESGTPASAGE
jgi:cell wall-associated NlpC family hydrolase